MLFDKFRKKYSNMNGRIRDEVNAWCRTWDQNKCQRCNVSFDELERQAQIQEEVTGRKRILPVFVDDHKDGDSSHLDGYIDVDEHNKPVCLNDSSKPARQVWHKFGNMRRICYPCNRIAGLITRKTVGSSVATREKQDRVNNEQVFIFECRQQIEERQHICKKEVCKAGKNICDSSEITCLRYIDTEINTVSNPKGEFDQFAYTCSGKFCNGEHICLHGVKPDVIIEEERRQLEREWEMQYQLPSGYKDEATAIRQWEQDFANLGRPWVSKEQYVNERLHMNW
jgi:hypothetical protein